MIFAAWAIFLLPLFTAVALLLNNNTPFKRAVLSAGLIYAIILFIPALRHGRFEMVFGTLLVITFGGIMGGWIYNARSNGLSKTDWLVALPVICGAILVGLYGLG